MSRIITKKRLVLGVVTSLMAAALGTGVLDHHR